MDFLIFRIQYKRPLLKLFKEEQNLPVQSLVYFRTVSIEMVIFNSYRGLKKEGNGFIKLPVYEIPIMLSYNVRDF